MKHRVHELAQELGIPSKQLLAELSELGEFVRSASSTLEEPVVRRIRERHREPAGKLGPTSSTDRPADSSLPGGVRRPSGNSGMTPLRVANNPFGARRPVKSSSPPLVPVAPGPRREFYRGQPVSGLTEVILRRKIVPRRTGQEPQPPRGYFADEVKEAQQIAAEWMGTLFDGLTAESIPDWLGDDHELLTPDQAVALYQAGIEPGDIAFSPTPSIRHRLSAGKITVEQAINEVRAGSKRVDVGQLARELGVHRNDVLEWGNKVGVHRVRVAATMSLAEADEIRRYALDREAREAARLDRVRRVEKSMRVEPGSDPWLVHSTTSGKSEDEIDQESLEILESLEGNIADRPRMGNDRS